MKPKVYTRFITKECSSNGVDSFVFGNNARKLTNLQITALVRKHGLMQNVLENSSLKQEMHSKETKVT